MLCIRGGLLYTMEQREPYVGDILIDEGKIVAIGPDLTIPEGTEIYDASGKNVYPGFVEAHGHIGLDGYGIGFEGTDFNEMNDIVACQLRAIDGIEPMDPAFQMAADAGVTCVCTGPGSANVLGGTFTAIKTIGKRVDRMIVKKEVAMKCAFGENPKRCYQNKGNSCRLSTAAKLREMLFKAKEYLAKKEAAGDDLSKQPAFDMKMEALIPVLKREIPLKAHAHQANDMFTALRIAKEFGLRITLEHCTEGHLVVDELVKENVPLAVGPSLSDATKFELRNRSFTTPGILARAGCQVSIITDSPWVPQQYLPLCAGLAVKSGMDPYDALKAITINPAKHIGIEDRVGSLAVGKDGDVVIAAGDPLESSTVIEATFIEGHRVH